MLYFSELTVSLMALNVETVKSTISKVAGTIHAFVGAEPQVLRKEACLGTSKVSVALSLLI